MIQALLVKTILGKVFEAIEKADDKRIARTHHKKLKDFEKRIKWLEKQARKK